MTKGRLEFVGLALALAALTSACAISIDGDPPASAPSASIVARPADPPVFVRSIRVAATDPEAVAGFYKRAFGMHEIRRINGQGFVEIVLNSGATPDEARANLRAPIVIMTRPKDLQVGAMASLILNVSDMQGTISAVQAAGGTLFRPPQGAASGVQYAFVKDPEGNQVELLTAR